MNSHPSLPEAEADCLLFLVLGIGYLLGKVRIAGFGLGVSAVLFIGPAFGGMSPLISLPELVYQLGLILFVYTVGVSAGPGFLGTLRRRGLPANVLVVVVLIGVAVTAGILGRATGQSRAVTAGVFTGATTNTPALAAVLQHAAESQAQDARALTDPVLGYSVAYAFGVLGMIRRRPRS